MSKGATKGVHTKERIVQFPKSISLEAQAYLSRLVGENGIPFNAFQPSPTPEDTVDWTAFQQQINASITKIVNGMAGQTRSRVTTAELNGARVHHRIPVDARPDTQAYPKVRSGALFYVGGKACEAGAAMQPDCGDGTARARRWPAPPRRPNRMVGVALFVSRMTANLLYAPGADLSDLTCRHCSAIHRKVFRPPSFRRVPVISSCPALFVAPSLAQA